jgi:hypothetical protein
MTMRIPFRSAFCAALAVTSAPLLAEDAVIPNNPALNDKFYFGAGVFMPTTTSTMSLNSTKLGVGTSVDVERLLGMQTTKGVPDFLARWRFTERWRVEAEYFQLNRTGLKTLSQDINWGDVTYPINTQVSSTLDMADARVSVGYSFFKTQDKELGVGLGFHVLSYNASLTANAVGTQGGAVTAPLPVLSGYGQFALTDQWAISARLDRFSLTYDQYSGNITSMAIDILYQPFRHVGFGLGYRGMYYDLKSTGTDWTGEIQQNFQGPVAYVTASF